MLLAAVKNLPVLANVSAGHAGMNRGRNTKAAMQSKQGG
jgi:hypothetical protein